RSTPRNTKGTPARHRHTSAVTAGEPADDNPELIKRREALGNAVWGRLSTEYTFTQFVSKMALRDEYIRYNAIVAGAFSDLAQNAPTITASTITSADGTIKRNIKEKDVSPHFISLYESMEVVAEEKLEGYGGQMYTFVDRQNIPVSGSSLKSDGLFCFADADESFSSAYAAIEMKKDKCVGTPPTQILGQVGDYALSIWKEQPLRMFVPVLLLHGPNLTLFVFTRGTVFQIELGQIGFTSTQRGKKGHSKIESTLTKLWFVLSIRPEQFGYACSISGNSSRLLIGRGDAEHHIALYACEDSISNDAMDLSSRIRRTVHLFGRVAYLYRTNYQGRKVVAKISWSQSDRLPECATYEVLHRDHVSGIPRVCMQGFVKSDFFGYRMELVLLEDCGSPIDESFSNLAQKRDFESATSLLSQYIKGVAKTLVSAYDAGVLHRDVSTGNITVSGTQAYLIDWGYSKFLDWANVDDIAEKWDFKKDEVLKNESAHDHMIGTPLFMSIQTLLESDMRSVIHDIESLFMVALYTLATLNSPSTDVVDAKHGWSFVRNEMTAWLRVGILAGRDGYLKRFGCDKCSDELKVVLDGLYSFLFVENGEFIGGRMIDNKDYERESEQHIMEDRGFLFVEFSEDDPQEPAPRHPSDLHFPMLADQHIMLAQGFLLVKLSKDSGPQELTLSNQPGRYLPIPANQRIIPT
ncbi:hypothetical protein EV175_001965, partial [Coemansia sp. RSA 1933]